MQAIGDMEDLLKRIYFPAHDVDVLARELTREGAFVSHRELPLGIALWSVSRGDSLRVRIAGRVDTPFWAPTEMKVGQKVTYPRTNAGVVYIGNGQCLVHGGLGQYTR